MIWDDIAVKLKTMEVCCLILFLSHVCMCTCELGYSSGRDHIPLLMTFPTSTLKIRIPVLKTIPAPKSCLR